MVGKMSTQKLKDAIRAAKSHPKGVKVSVDLFKDLKSAGEIASKPYTPWGLDLPSLRLDLPTFGDGVVVICDPMLDGMDFELPPVCAG
jgi:hypothetical protein